MFSRALGLVALAALPRVASGQDSVARAARSIEVHGFVQVYYRTGDPLTNDGYRLRKADLKFSGDLSPRLRWRVGFDASKVLNLTKTTEETNGEVVLSDVSIDQRGRMLQDAALTLSFPAGMRLDVGQQIIPLSLEGTTPTSQVETIERTMFIVERSRAIGLGDIRDIGASLNGVAADAFEYHLGLFNETGESQNSTDTNDQKAVMGRFALHLPRSTRFQIGGSGGFQGGPAVSERRERAAGEAQYKDSHLTIRSELMAARDGDLHRFGWYALTAARPTRTVQLVARFDAWDRDLRADATIANSYTRQLTGGASYLFDAGAAKLAVNVIRQTYTNSLIAPSTFALFAFQGVW